MIKLTEERVADILAYMEDDLPNCLYIYGDIERYGVNDPNIKVWFSEKDGNINAVVMQYFSGAHVYSKNLDYDKETIAAKIREICPDRLSSQREIIQALYPVFQEEYDVEYGTIVKFVKQRGRKPPVPIEEAKPKDAEEIADLMMSDAAWSGTYDKSRLASEIAGRIRSGVGRSYVMRDGGRIVAHDSIALETKRYVVASLAMVHADYQKKMWGLFLENFLINKGVENGKDDYGMIQEDSSVKGFMRTGNQPVAQYGKLFRKSLKGDTV